MPDQYDILTLDECQTLIDSVDEWEAINLERHIGGEYQDVERGGVIHFKQCFVDFWKEQYTGMRVELLTKYDVGDYCGLHFDSNWWSREKPWVAHTTWITPLNNDFEGGDLFVQGVKYEQEVGVPIKFPRLWEHEITEVTSGTRYSLVSWLFQKEK